MELGHRGGIVSHMVPIVELNEHRIRRGSQILWGLQSDSGRQAPTQRMKRKHAPGSYSEALGTITIPS